MCDHSSSTMKPTSERTHRWNQEQFNGIIQNERENTWNREGGALTSEKRKRKDIVGKLISERSNEKTLYGCFPLEFCN